MANNLGLPENLYSGGQGIFNSTPATNFYLQNQARKRARDEALTKYYGDFTKSINPAGMRNQDVDGLMSKVNDMKKFYMDNADLIKNPTKDNGKAYTEYMSRYQDNLNYVNHSKQESENKKPFITELGNPELRSRISDEAMNYVHSTDLPINDPNHVDFDYAKIIHNPKPFTLDDEAKMLHNLTQNKKMDVQEELGATDPKTFMRTKTTRNVFQPEVMQSIGQDAASEYTDNSSYKQKIDKLFDSWYNPKSGQVELPSQYNDVFKSTYGKDIHVPQELAAAYALNKIQSQSIKTEIEEDKFAQQKAMEGIKQGNRERSIDLKKQAAQELQKGETGWVNTYLEGIIAKSKSELPEVQSGSLYTENEPIVNDPLISKALERNGQEPDVTTYTKKGQIYPIYYQRYPEDVTDNNGKVIYQKGEVKMGSQGVPLRIEQYSKPLTAQQVKALMLNVAPKSKLAASEMGLIFGEDAGDDGSEGVTLPTKYKAKMSDGSIITSDDGTNWVDSKGNPVK